MASEIYKKRVDNIILKAKKKNKVTKYKDFCKTDLAKKTSLNYERFLNNN